MSLPTTPPRVMRGATAGTDGASGYVAKPAAGQEAYVLLGDGTWAAQPSGTVPSQTTHSGKLLTTNGTDASWTTTPTATSLTGVTDLTLTGGSTGASLVLGQGATAGGVSTMSNAGVQSMRIDQANRVIIGTGGALQGDKLEIQGVDGSAAQSIWRFSADAAGPSLTLRKSRGATIAAQGLVSSGDTIGNLLFMASDGVASRNAAQIAAEVDGTAAASSMPGRLVFKTTPTGSVTLATAATITATGNLLIGTTTDAASLAGGLVVNGSGAGAAASSTTTGALRVTGGVGVSGAGYFGGNTFVTGTSRASAGFLDTAGTSGILFGSGPLSLGFYLAGGLYANLTSTSLNIPITTSASSSTVGALTIGNGTAATNVAIGGGAINAGGTGTFGSTLTVSGPEAGATTGTSIVVNNTTSANNRVAAIRLTNLSNYWNIRAVGSGDTFRIGPGLAGSETDYFTLSAAGAATFAGAVNAAGNSVITSAAATPAFTVSQAYNADALVATTGAAGYAVKAATTGYYPAIGVVQTTGSATSGNSVAGLYVAGTYTHSSTGGASGPIGLGADISVANNTAVGILYGARISATANTASAQAIGLDVTAASTSGTKLAAAFRGAPVSITDSTPSVGSTSGALQIPNGGIYAGAASVFGTSIDVTTAALANSSQLTILNGNSSAKTHVGNFSNQTYLSTNSFYNGAQATDNAALSSSTLVLGADRTFKFYSAAPAATPALSLMLTLDGANNLSTFAGGLLTQTGGFRSAGALTLGATYASIGGGFQIDYASPVTTQYFGDGTGFSMVWATRAASTTTPRMTLTDAGNLTVHGIGGVQLNSVANLTWGGAYGAGIPAIAVPSAGKLGFYPNGSTSGLIGEFSSTGLAVTGEVSLSSTNDNPFRVTQSRAVYNPQLAAFLNSTALGGASTQAGPYITFGVAQTTNNAGQLMFGNFGGLGSAANTVFLSIYGATHGLIIDGAGTAKLSATTPSTGSTSGALQVTGGIYAGAASVFGSTAKINGTGSADSPLHVYESAAAGTGNGITVEQAGAGDAAIQFLLTGVQRWSAGIDNSDSDAFVIGTGALGSANVLKLATTGAATFAGAVTGNSTFSSGVLATTAGGYKLFDASGYFVDFRPTGARTYVIEGDASGNDYSTSFTNAGAGKHNLAASGTLSITGAATFAGAVTVAGTVIHTLSATPASASATGTVGTMSWDANYIYICTATNVWKRVAIATW